jgi:predicted transcriptional regulator of viral defense system
MKNIAQVFEKNYGYATLSDLKSASVHTSRVRRLVEEGHILRVSPGLYRLADMPLHAQQGMIDACMAMKNAVVCLHSALSFFDLTTTAPGAVMLALPRGAKPKKVFYPPVRVFYFSARNYEPGIESIATGSGTIRIYCREKSVIDSFRYRNRLGLDVALEALKEYMRAYPNNLGILSNWAKQGRMFTMMRRYLELFAEG